MAYRVLLLFVLSLIMCVRTEEEHRPPMSREERTELREEARKMFYHAYNAYMDNAYPADELMPLSCKGRWRGVTPSRGDMDDVLGNFSLTLIDSLDMLAVIGDFSEFSRAIKLVVDEVTFDNDIVVSVFETNIRVLGGLLSAHVIATALKNEDVPVIQWYNGELLKMAEDLGKRLLPAFDTSTGIPYGRVNLRHGLRDLLTDSSETCTACAGTMILEMAALSRLCGDPIYEEKAHKSMDRLWKIRHRTSDLMGTVINIHSGDWVRKDSGVGAGIDSYYEYCLKAYILLGDEKYLARFTRHYNAVMKYISRGPVMLAVHMHRPHLQSRNFMDALLAFWPGLQVLLGDLRPAVETHEMLYQVMQRHTFIPEAFTPDFQVHWGQHPLRPEFLESTYFLHRATGDDHYLRVGKTVMKALQKYTRVACGYAAVNDVRTRIHEDRMDSFVLAETFKYLYMLFGYDKDLPLKIENYVMTTEAHFLPLELSIIITKNATFNGFDEYFEEEDKYTKYCPNSATIAAAKYREPMQQLLGTTPARPKPRLRPLADPRQLDALAEMGISVITMPDGRVQLLYATSSAKSPKEAEEGLLFMREMTKWNAISDLENGVVPIGVKLCDRILSAGPAHFGKEIRGDDRYTGQVALVVPIDACGAIENIDEVEGKFGMAVRGACTFTQKVRNMQAAGVKLAIIIDSAADTTADTSTLFAMSGDGQDDIEIPALFLYNTEGKVLSRASAHDSYLKITVGELKYLRQENPNICDDEDSCEATIDVRPEDHEEQAFDKLKYILSHIVAQFEISLADEEAKMQQIWQDDNSEQKIIQENFKNENEIDGTETYSGIDEFVKNFEKDFEQDTSTVVRHVKYFYDEKPEHSEVDESNGPKGKLKNENEIDGTEIDSGFKEFGKSLTHDISTDEEDEDDDETRLHSEKRESEDLPGTIEKVYEINIAEIEKALKELVKPLMNDGSAVEREVNDFYYEIPVHTEIDENNPIIRELKPHEIDDDDSYEVVSVKSEIQLPSGPKIEITTESKLKIETTHKKPLQSVKYGEANASKHDTGIDDTSDINFNEELPINSRIEDDINGLIHKINSEEIDTADYDDETPFHTKINGEANGSKHAINTDETDDDETPLHSRLDEEANDSKHITDTDHIDYTVSFDKSPMYPEKDSEQEMKEMEAYKLPEEPFEENQ